MSAIEKHAVSFALVVLVAIIAGFVAYMPEPTPEPAPIVKQVRGIQGPSAVFEDF